MDNESKKKILVVEDEAIVQTLIKRELEDHHFLVITASDGEEGLKMADQERPDVILLDILLPKMNGLVVVQKLRQQGSWGKSVPIILLGNGIGAVAVRQFTVKNIEAVKKYRYLKNGAMYSVMFLGAIMIANAFGVHIPEWFSPIVTIGVLAYFFLKSKRELSATAAAKMPAKK
jgi:CheY-like chemotaxis protein